MNEPVTHADATFEGTCQRQMLLGLELTMRQRLEWLESRRAEVASLQAAMARSKQR